MEGSEELTEVVTNTRKLFTELFTSGFLSIHDSTLEALKRTADICSQCGLTFGGEKLMELWVEIRGLRHQLNQDFSKTMELYCTLEKYFVLCQNKLELDSVQLYGNFTP
ncbi:hypothetical protein acsn021_18460 [Anaerocolumna cellulosilytica]|uniref:Uncharacterized protein n=1 Tax=Anaerocolumna cellulosilytica TaxID=433286 RepID=A0A6S6R2H4_9FIRM|nr:hypothetical protein [Anaerocolumna cellulosilytica]MBB5194760.1 hypothetical protein [Anaerocolumna cellulosilytica]BCJ94277.1 hypothetical protein acsn021_18460 [Anaerocolumna cellulosilytica]